MSGIKKQVGGLHRKKESKNERGSCDIHSKVSIERISVDSPF